MGLFRKKNKFLDLTKEFEKQQEKLEHMKKEAQEEQQKPSASPLGNAFNMFSSQSPLSTQSSSSKSSSLDNYPNLSTTIDEKKRRLTKRILEMTSKMEDISNQIYHLEQRIEVIERKTDLNRF